MILILSQNYTNQSPFLTQTKFGNGTFYKFNSTLFGKNNDFSNHALFVPIFLKINELSIQNNPSYHVIGENNKINLDRDINSTENSDNQYTISDDELQFIPKRIKENFTDYTIFTDEILNAGFYNLSSAPSVGKSEVFAVNYNRLESDLNFLNIDELKTVFDSNLNEIIDSGNLTSAIDKHIKEKKGQSLWIYFIFAALMFFLIEILLIRFLK